MTDYEDLRGVLGRSLGEIMDYCLVRQAGQDMSRAHSHPSAATSSSNVPVGMRAVDSGLINNEVREGLLIAQAAERTLKAVEATEAFLDVSRDYLIQKGHYDWRKDVRFDDLDSVFSHIGLSFDSPDLISAQAAWHLAVLMENHERRAVAQTIANKHQSEKTNTGSLDRRHLNGFRKLAGENFRKAGGIIAANGMPELGEAISKIAADYVTKNHDEIYSAVAYARALLSFYHERRNRSSMENALMDTLGDRIDQIDHLYAQEREMIGAQSGSGRRDFF